MSETINPTNGKTSPRTRAWMGFYVTLFGLFIFIVGAKPEWLGMNRSPVIGFIQIAVFLVGLAIISIGGYVGLGGVWGDDERSIAFDFGLRLVATGYVLAVFAGMADIFGMGTQPFPEVPFFGPLQAIGTEIGQIMIALGFFLMLPYEKMLKKR